MNATTRRNSLISILAVTLLSPFLFAQDAPPTQQQVSSPPATQAISQHENTLKKLRETYFQSLIDADKQEILALDFAMDDAMNAHDLDEANRINAARDAAEAVLKEHKLQSLDAAPIKLSKPTPLIVAWTKTFEINARDRRQVTIDVQKGHHYRIKASGIWSHAPGLSEGPDGKPIGDSQGLRAGRGYYLEGRVGDGLPFGIGSYYELFAIDDGPLEMEMVDYGYDDNSGSLQVTIESLGNEPAAPQSSVAPEIPDPTSPPSPSTGSKLFLPPP